MIVLFLHGWNSTPGGVKPTYLANSGHTVLNPALPDEDFAQALRVAQAEVDLHHPDVIVGSSRGGAVAMNLEADGIPLVLLCPAWKHWGMVGRVRQGTVVLHSEGDNIIAEKIAASWCNAVACQTRPWSSLATTTGSPMPNRSKPCWALWSRRWLYRKTRAIRRSKPKGIGASWAAPIPFGFSCSNRRHSLGRRKRGGSPLVFDLSVQPFGHFDRPAKGRLEKTQAIEARLQENALALGEKVKTLFAMVLPHAAWTHAPEG